jgi:hypothetical protein
VKVDVFSKRKNWQPEDVIASQLAMNAETWKALQAHGVDEKSEVRLDLRDLAAFPSSP